MCCSRIRRDRSGSDGASFVIDEQNPNETDVANPNATNPHTTSPYTTSPDTASPHVASPPIESPHVHRQKENATKSTEAINV